MTVSLYDVNEILIVKKTPEGWNDWFDNKI